MFLRLYAESSTIEDTQRGHGHHGEAILTRPGLLLASGASRADGLRALAPS